MVNIGERVRNLRERSGMSQQKLSELLGVSRPTVSQLEAGSRKICTEELEKLSEIFGMSVDELLHAEKEPEVVFEKSLKGRAEDPVIRISVPQKNLKKFREVLLYILNKIGSKPNIGETVIYKLLYFIDFDFYEKYEEQLIGATYIKNKFGPTPVEFRKIVDRMIQDEEIEKIKSNFFQYEQSKYLPLRIPNLSILKANEIKAIDDVLNRLSDMNAKQISAYSHNDVPWLTTQDGKKIDYESVFYRTAEYSVRDDNE